MGFFSHRVQRLELQPGDHIYTWRKLFAYAHHGIYIAENSVIHFIPPHGPPKSIKPAGSERRCSVCQFSGNSSGVVKSCVDCFLEGYSLYRFQYAVSRLPYLIKRFGTCLTDEEERPIYVLQRASSLLVTGFGQYDLFKNNCEDFAIYCKTGKTSSSSRGRSKFGASQGGGREGGPSNSQGQQSEQIKGVKAALFTAGMYVTTVAATFAIQILLDAANIKKATIKEKEGEEEETVNGTVT